MKFTVTVLYEDAEIKKNHENYKHGQMDLIWCDLIFPPDIPSGPEAERFWYGRHQWQQEGVHWVSRVQSQNPL